MVILILYALILLNKDLSMEFKIFTLIITLSFVGCSSSYRVTSTGQHADLSFNELNEKIKSDKLTISFNGREIQNATEFHIENDSAFWKKETDGTIFKTSVSELRYISSPADRWEGVSKGAGTGIIIGGVTGILIGSQLRSSSHGDEGMMAFINGLAGGGIGAITGAVVGAVVTKSHKYYFTTEAPKK